jgi:predicted dehydrogenase
VKALRVGLIGCGGAGLAHLYYFTCVSGAEVVKVFDTSVDALGRARAFSPALTLVTKLDDLWSGLDAVTVCSPDSTHAPYVEQALERGLHVLCEKPLADSRAGLLAIRRAERRADRVVAVLHQMRFLPLHEAIKETIDRNEVGTIGYLEGLYVHNLKQRAFVHGDWRRRDNATPLVYSGVHMVDLLRWFAHDEIAEVFASANHRAFPEYPESDLNLATLRFASGILGKVLVAFGAAGPQDHSVKVFGDEASIENNVLFDGDGRWARTLHSPPIVHRALLSPAAHKVGFDLFSQVRGNLRSHLAHRAFGLMRRWVRGPQWQFGMRFYPMRLYEHYLACVRAVADFVDAVRENRPPRCTTAEASQAVLACLAGVESYRTNRPVPVPLLREIEEAEPRGPRAGGARGTSSP